MSDAAPHPGPQEQLPLPPPLLAKGATDALKALLELASAPHGWRSSREIARAQHLPEPMLEQVLLRLRRAGLVEARRGRMGGYRLARPAGAIAIGKVLATMQPLPPDPGAVSAPSPADQVTRALEQRLQRALRRALDDLTLEELLFDLRSAEACHDGDGGLLLG